MLAVRTLPSLRVLCVAVVARAASVYVCWRPLCGGSCNQCNLVRQRKDGKVDCARN